MALQSDQEHDDRVSDTICIGCDIPQPVNHLGLCLTCDAKLERDLIRDREWDYSALAFGVNPERYETLREQIIREYGAGYELLVSPAATRKPKRKNKQSRFRETQRKREIAAQAMRGYTTEDVLHAARQFIQQQFTEWVSFSRLSQHLHETFYKLKPKHLGQPGKKYNSLRKFLGDYPDEFELRVDEDKPTLYWIRVR